MNILRQQILDYIVNLYKANYTGPMKVTNENGLYTLMLGIPNIDTPTFISLQTDSSEEFLKYVFDELRTRNYMRVYFYKVNRNEIYK